MTWVYMLDSYCWSYIKPSFSCKNQWRRLAEDNDPRLEDNEEDDDSYDWSDKSGPIEKETWEVDAEKQSEEAAKSEEVAHMAPEQPKVDTSLSDSNKPSNYVPLPDEVRENLCSAECLEQIEHYRTYSFKICDKLNKEEKMHKKLKKIIKFQMSKILSLQSSWNKTIFELESIKIQFKKMTKSLEVEK